MLTNEIRKGDRILLRNGWYGTMKDNARGQTRIAEVEGFYTETGSVYAHDIVAAQKVDGGQWTRITHTPAQEQLRLRLVSMGMA